MRRKTALVVCLISASFLLNAEGPSPQMERPESSVVYHVRLSGIIDKVAATHVARALSVAEKEGAQLIIVDINTPGGQIVGGMWETRDSLLSTSIPTVAWVNKDAASAGAMITYACDYIVTAPGATFGACVPIVISPISTEGPKVLPEKFISYTRGQIRSVASKNGHDPDIAEAMVDQDKEILFSDKISPTRRREFLRILEGWDKASAEEREQFKWFLDPSGELSEQRRKVLMGYLAPGAKIVEKGKVLTLDTDVALLLNVAIGEASTLHEIFQLKEIQDLNLGRPIVNTVKRSWSEVAAAFLSHPIVSSLLLIGGIIGIATELKMPGFGFPGILGLSCIGLLFFGNFAAGAAQWTDLILFGLGVTLLLLELFVIPGFGFVGIAGIILIVASIFMMVLKSPGPHLPYAREEVLRVIRWMSASLIVSAAGIFILFKLLTPRMPLFGRLVLGTSERALEGYTAGEKFATQADVLVGKVGEAKSMLRPAGKAVFNGKLFDVVTEGDMIEKGSQIEIIEVKGNRIVVQKAKES